MKNSGFAPWTRMSFTQWLTMSWPTVSCLFIIAAIFSFVPTPSADATRIMSLPVGTLWSPPNAPMFPMTFAVFVDATISLIEPMAFILTSMLTPAWAYADFLSVLSSLATMTPVLGGEGESCFKIKRKARAARTRPSPSSSELVVRAQDLDDLVHVDLLHLVTRRTEVLARIEFARLVVEDLADRRGHRETRVGVDVDLADRALRGLAELLFRNADRVGELAAEAVDLIDVFLRNRAGPVEDDRKARELLLDLLEDVERERRRNELARLGIARALRGRELERAVAGADGDREGVAACLGRELDHFLGLRVVRLGRGDLVFDAREDAELGFDGDVVLVRVGDDLLRQLDVLLE